MEDHQKRCPHPPEVRRIVTPTPLDQHQKISEYCRDCGALVIERDIEPAP